MFSTFRDFLWILALALVLCFGFFVLVGAFSPDEVVPITIGVGVLIALLAGRGLLELRRRDGGLRDLASIRARERRGF